MSKTSSYLDRYFEKTPEQKRSSAAIAFLASLDHISKSTPLISDAILNELKDQRSHLKMIASENFCSLAVQLAMGNLLTDKYAEGYPHHRFYAGCENIDVIEQEAQNQLKHIFGCDHAYVQPHSGADANLVAYWAILLKNVQSKEVERLGKKNIDELTPDEYEAVRQLLVNQKVLGLSLNSGGHLTHGYKHNVSSKMMKATFYEVDPETETLDYENILKRAREEKPQILLAGYSAHPRRLNFRKMREIADAVGATLMVDMAHFAGLVAGKAFTGEYNPVPFADIITSTTHKTLRGPRGGIVLCSNEYKEFVDKGCPLVLGGPLPHVMAAKSIAFKEAGTKEFEEYAHSVVENAKVLADELKKQGLRLVSDGTENHMVIVDVTKFNITGRQAEQALRKAKITANRNAIPFDPNGPWYTSGIRLGTQALTTLGMKAPDMKRIATIIVKALHNTKSVPNSRAQCLFCEKSFEELEKEVHTILQSYPLYPEISLYEPKETTEGLQSCPSKTTIREEINLLSL